MPQYQTTEILPETMMKGSCKVEYAPIVADHTTAVWVDVGACDDPVFTEELTPLEGSPSNSTKPKINIGVADQKINISFNPWSYDPTNFIAMRGGIDTLETDVDGNRSVFSGGGCFQDSIMMRFSNRRCDVATADDVTQYPNESLTVGDAIYRDTKFIAFKCHNTSGMNVAFKRDDDTDPALRFPLTFMGEQDTTRATGKQTWVTEYSVTKIV